MKGFKNLKEDVENEIILCDVDDFSDFYDEVNSFNKSISLFQNLKFSIKKIINFFYLIIYQNLVFNKLASIGNRNRE